MNDYCPKGIVSFLLIIGLVANSLTGQAQSNVVKGGDSNYYRSYDTTFTVRMYLTQKYLSLIISGGSKANDLKYRPNSKLNIGAGVTYGWITLNADFGFGFLNKGDEDKGKTKSLDLQLHSYGRKISVDLSYQYYRGLYLYPKGSGLENKENWYVRPDIRLLQIGGSAYYATNWRKFSYRAALLQNEWQIKSAGSFLLGAQASYGQSKGDSALVPAAIAGSYSAAGVKQVTYGSIAPGIGYAYSLVIARHWFATAGIISSLAFGLLKETRDTSKSTMFSARPNFTYKAGIGYNSRRFTTSLSLFDNSLGTKSSKSGYRYEAGNVRLDIAYRFLTGAKAKRMLRIFQN